MERREHYDPEDLEHLLLERGYDELLEEERSFVLRHLSGRAEYESMRALLHTVRHDERDHPPMEADPIVRERVLEAFRAQKRPQWSIWLNSVKAVLWPEQASAFWKPALAFATLALVVTTTVIGLRSLDTSENAVAEVRQEQPKATTTLEDRKNEAPQAAPVVEEAPAVKSTLDQAPATAPTYKGADESGLAEAEENVTAPPAPESPVQAPLAAYDVDVASSDAPALDSSSKWAFDAKAEADHVVTAGELATNMSIANVAGAVTMKELSRKEKKGKERGKDNGAAEAGTDATAYVGLLRAAW